MSGLFLLLAQYQQLMCMIVVFLIIVFGVLAMVAGALVVSYDTVFQDHDDVTTHRDSGLWARISAAWKGVA